MKKFFTLLLSTSMLMTLVTVNAINVTEGWTNGADSGSIVTFNGANQAINKSMNGEPIGETPLEYSFNVKIDEEYKHGYLFTSSIGLNGTDENQGRTNEMAVMTQVTRDGDKYIVHVNYAGEEFTFENNYINHSGIYTYTYTVSKNEDGTAHVILTVDDYGKVLGTLTADLGEDALQLGLPSTMRYLWVFGRDIDGNSGYTFDTPLQLYKELPYADEQLWIDTLNSYNANGNYTDESKQAVEAVITSYKSDLANTAAGKVRAADQNIIQSYASRLNDAIAKLVTKPSEKVEESTSNDTTTAAGWDDGGPFTTDACGNVFDRWGNEVWHAPVCATAQQSTNTNYSLVNTSDR